MHTPGGKVCDSESPNGRLAGRPPPARIVDDVFPLGSIGAGNNCNDLVGVAHYARQDLWFTSLFYGVLVVMAIVGLRAWALRRPTAIEAP